MENGEFKLAAVSIVEARGQLWEVVERNVTSDGFVMGWGWLLDENGDRTEIGHSLFLGSAR